MLKKLFFLGLLSFCLLNLVFLKQFFQFPFSFQTFAQINLDDCDREKPDDTLYLQCMTEKKSQLEEKIKETRAQTHTLTNAINLTNSQVQLQQIQIAQTQTEISLLEKEIFNLNERIDGLVLSIDRLSEMLVVRVQASYKQNRVNPVIALFTKGTFSDFINQYKYLQQAEKQIAKAMQEAESQRILYDEQKNIKELKQGQLEAKRAQLLAQKKELERNKQAKQRLLTDTKNDESTYQRLLAEAQKEINSFRVFVTAQFGSSYCLDSPAAQPDGWFFSQRDSRWCQSRIGNSSDSIGAVGCLITSTAMIWKKYGADVTPLSIANTLDFFRLNTAYMILPTPPPPGYKSNTYGRDLGIIDSELAAGRPVIVRLSVYFNSVGTHFIVLKSGSDGNYIMNDPIYEADMTFNSKYSTGQITGVRTFTPS